MGRRDEYDYEEEVEEEDEEEEEEEVEYGGGRKRRRSEFIDDVAEEDDEEEEYEEDEDDDLEEEGRRGRHKQRRKSGAEFFDLEAKVDSDEEEEEEGEEDDFIVDGGAEIGEEDADRIRHHRRPPILSQEEDQLDIDQLRKQIHERYARPSHMEYGEEATEVEQQALLPSVKDPKLWMIKCQIGREREAIICLMQKYIDKGSELQIRSAVALDHLKNYIYVEAEKESHVREACKGLRSIFQQKVQLVPIKEMTDVLSVESKLVDLTTDTWVRMKLGIYKGDLGKVVEVDNVRQRATIKLIPRVDLQAIADKLSGKTAKKKKSFVPPPRFFNSDEAEQLGVRPDRRRFGGVYYDLIDNLKFRDGFLYKTVSLKSISTQNVQPSFEELEKFRGPSDDTDGDLASLSTLFANRKKGHFMKGDAVIVVRGELKDLKGWVEKVEEDTVHVKPKMEGLMDTLTFNEKELCKYFKIGDHVKVVTGVQAGTTGMVVKVEGHVLIIISDTTKEDIRVFADNVVESSEVTSGATRIGDYELHDLVLLDNMSFGVIIRIESDAFQVLKGVPDRPETVLVKLREIKNKIDRKSNAQDRHKNIVSAKDIVRVIEGPCKGKLGPVEHIHRGILFIHDRHHLEHGGFICAKSHSCSLVGGSRNNRDRNGDALDTRFEALRSLPIPQSPMRTPGPPRFGGGRHRGGRGHDPLAGRTIKIRLGQFKGYRGRVTEANGDDVRVELDSQMKTVMVKRNQISDSTSIATPARETGRYGLGSETPMHPSRTPLHPYMTPMRDPGATPIHDGMRTPMRDRAWNPYAPMSPARDNWDDANPATWGSSPQYQPSSPARSRAYEAPTPGSGWVNTPGGGYTDVGTPRENTAYGNAPSPYVPSTPGQPMTPNSMPYLPGTPGGQPMTPGNVGGLDVMSPAMGGEGEGNWFAPDILVNVHWSGENPHVGVVKEVLVDGSCKVAIGPSGSGDVITALPTEVEVVPPKKSDKIKILSGSFRGLTGKLIGVDGSDGIVKLDETLDTLQNVESQAPSSTTSGTAGMRTCRTLRVISTPSNSVQLMCELVL